MTAPTGPADVAAWEAGGERIEVDGHRVWCRVDRATGPEVGPPLLVCHGFPTCSYDLVRVLGRLAAGRDVVSFDDPGFGLSDKPDQPCAAADAIARSQLHAVRARIARLKALELELERMVEQCAHGVISDCRVIEVLGDHGKCSHDHTSSDVE